MNHDYQDIRSRILEQPKWYDEHAVPRYCEFEPNRAANIYAAEVALALIQCQRCEKQFRVCFSWALGDDVIRGEQSVSSDVTNRSLHYGDPPNVHCCPAGPTMNSEMIRVLEFWRRAAFGKFARVPELEVEFERDSYEQGL